MLYFPHSNHRHIVVSVLLFVDLQSDFGFSFLSVFLRCCVVLVFVGCVCSATGCSGEHHEGEDAQERREVVVLLAGQKQQHQIGNFISPVDKDSESVALLSLF